jgi:probable phosphoglycerate mutase
MTTPLPRITLVRHGQTPWSLTGQHTGRKDIPLTPAGEDEARRVGQRLQGHSFRAVLTSPLRRARHTCELAGFGSQAEEVPDLMEWNYGEYEGLRTSEIHQRRPEWHIFRDGCPGGERLEEVAARADRVVKRLLETGGDVLIFSHGHLLRILGARWAELPPQAAARFLLSSGSLSVLGQDPSFGDRVVVEWNDVSHLEAKSGPG